VGADLRNTPRLLEPEALGLLQPRGGRRRHLGPVLLLARRAIESIAWNTRLEAMIGRDLLLLVPLGVGCPIIGVRVAMDAVVVNRVIGPGMGRQRLVDEWANDLKNGRPSAKKKKTCLLLTNWLTFSLFSCCCFFLPDILSIYLKQSTFKKTNVSTLLILNLDLAFSFTLLSPENI
jgi:hypothetical protein